MDFINRDYNKEDMINARADFFKNVFNNKTEFKYQTIKIFNELNSQKNILPQTLEREILIEPLKSNSLKNYITVTNIPYPEFVILDMLVNTEYSIDDQEVKKEIEASGNLITFEPYRDLLSVKVTDSVYYGTNTKFVEGVENALRSTNEQIEIERLFDEKPKESYKHMSLYTCGITSISAATIYDSLKVAIQDLPKEIRRNSKIVMNSKDYIELIEYLATKGITKIPFPQEIIIEEECKSPIVGDLKFIHINYDRAIDNAMQYDIYKKPKDGLFYFSLSVFKDMHIKLKSAFRIAKKQ